MHLILNEVLNEEFLPLVLHLQAFYLGLLLLLLFKRLPLKEYKSSTSPSSKFTGQKKKLIPQSLSLQLNLIFLQQQGCLIRLLACIVCLLLISDEQRLLLVFCYGLHLGQAVR